jgi:hypothetical protein
MRYAAAAVSNLRRMRAYRGSIRVSAASKACQQLVKHVSSSVSAYLKDACALTEAHVPTAPSETHARLKEARYAASKACQRLVKHVSS